ncbi:MAG: hypothetical protein NVS2B14_09570 [Chamaesiphon sp.]
MNTDPIEQNSPLVLVVDDDKSMRMLLRLALEQEGYRVVEAKDGEACLAAYKNHQPDAILLDGVMPVMDGFSCCTQLRSLIGSDTCGKNSVVRTPILMITVLDDPDSIERAFEVGTTDYITKPIQWSVLRHRVRRLIEQSVQTRYIESLTQQLEQANQKLARYEGMNLD